MSEYVPPPLQSVPLTTAPLCIFKSSWAKGLCSLYSLMQYNSGFEIFFCIVKLKYYSILAEYQTWWGFHKQRVLVTFRRSRASVSNDQTHTQQWHFIFHCINGLFCVNKTSLTIIAYIVWKRFFRNNQVLNLL